MEKARIVIGANNLSENTGILQGEEIDIYLLDDLHEIVSECEYNECKYEVEFIKRFNKPRVVGFAKLIPKKRMKDCSFVQVYANEIEFKE